jgi:hypothetical protein
VEIRRPFQLIGASEGKYPLPEDPHRSKTISLSMEKPEFVVRAVPRVGGTFEEISAFFQRTPTIFERARPRFRLSPAIHYVSPDVVGVISLRIIGATKAITARREQTHGESRCGY